MKQLGGWRQSKAMPQLTTTGASRRSAASYPIVAEWRSVIYRGFDVLQ
jgi:hypothetical protein